MAYVEWQTLEIFIDVTESDDQEQYLKSHLRRVTVLIKYNLDLRDTTLFQQYARIALTNQLRIL